MKDLIDKKSLVNYEVGVSLGNYDVKKIFRNLLIFSWRKKAEINALSIRRGKKGEGLEERRGD
jgi:hypothetical protein